MLNKNMAALRKVSLVYNLTAIPTKNEQLELGGWNILWR
jgi:hypothetical protein